MKKKKKNPNQTNQKNPTIPNIDLLADHMSLKFTGLTYLNS